MMPQAALLKKNRRSSVESFILRTVSFDHSLIRIDPLIKNDVAMPWPSQAVARPWAREGKGSVKSVREFATRGKWRGVCHPQGRREVAGSGSQTPGDPNGLGRFMIGSHIFQLSLKKGEPCLSQDVKE